MLIARIKGVNRSEKTRWVFGNKPSFTYKGCTYHIDPACIYNAKAFLGVWTVRCIDFVQDNSEPVGYYSEAWKRPHANKNLDTISMIVKRWLQSLGNMDLYILIISIVAAVAAVISCVISYMGLPK